MVKGKTKCAHSKNVPYWASFSSCCQGNLKFLSDNTLNCLSQPGFNLISGKRTKIENKQDNTLVLIVGREKNKLQDKASARIEYISFRSNQGFLFNLSLFFLQWRNSLLQKNGRENRCLVSVIELMVLQIICLLESCLLVFSDRSWKEAD